MPTYTKHPLNKRFPAPIRAEDSTTQLLLFSERITAFTRDVRATFKPVDTIFAMILNSAYKARLHARHPEYHGGKALANFDPDTGAYSPIKNGDAMTKFWPSPRRAPDWRTK